MHIFFWLSFYPWDVKRKKMGEAEEREVEVEEQNAKFTVSWGM